MIFVEYFIKQYDVPKIMFTGIVEGVGVVEKISTNTKNHSAIKITVDLQDIVGSLKIGQSVALNGVCLTVTKLVKNRCNFEMIDETIKKTDLGCLKKGSIVNIEQSLKASDRLEGHFVLGHVDGIATITQIQKKPGEIQVWIKVPKKLEKYIVLKGSIAVDGISLTVAGVEQGKILVCLIPHTANITNFKTKKIGDNVNIETDILGKYILGKK